MDTEEKIVSYLTINRDTRKIADEESRKDILLLKTQIKYLAEQCKDILLLKTQIKYLAEQLNITLPEEIETESNEE